MKPKEASAVLAEAMMTALMHSPAMPAARDMLAKMVVGALLDVDLEETSAPPRTPARRDAGQQLLPFAEREYIDMARAAKILGVGKSKMRELCGLGLVEMVDYDFHRRKRVLYRSIVELCDRLRREYSIADRRPPLPGPHFRHRDEDLLPFALSDSMTPSEAAAALGYSTETPIYQMIEEGRFEAYRLHKEAFWRISRTSFAAYVLRAHRGAAALPDFANSVPSPRGRG